MKTKPLRHIAKYEALLDDIKDAIDTLHDIKSAKRRNEAARDLIDYIELHHEPVRSVL